MTHVVSSVTFKIIEGGTIDEVCYKVLPYVSGGEVIKSLIDDPISVEDVSMYFFKGVLFDDILCCRSQFTHLNWS